MIVPHDLPAGLAPGLVYIQYQLEETLDLLWYSGSSSGSDRSSSNAPDTAASVFPKPTE